MSIVFENQLDFERAVMNVLVERLNIHVAVSKVRSQDYYSQERETKVAVTLNCEYAGTIDSDEDQA